jgi:hypothetical protein
MLCTVVIKGGTILTTDGKAFATEAEIIAYLTPFFGPNAKFVVLPLQDSKLQGPQDVTDMIDEAAAQTVQGTSVIYAFHGSDTAQVTAQGFDSNWDKFSHLGVSKVVIITANDSMFATNGLGAANIGAGITCGKKGPQGKITIIENVCEINTLQAA